MAKPIVITLLGDESDLERSLNATGRDVSELGQRLATALQEATGEAADMGDAVADGVKKAAKETEGFGSKLKGAALLAGAGIAAALAGGLKEAMDREKGNDLLAAQVGATPEQAKTLGQAAGKIFSSGLGESMEEVNDGLKSLWQQGLVPAGATADEIAGIGSKLMDVAQIMGEDLGPTANAAGQMVKNGLVKNYVEAMDLLVRGTQVGVNKSEDFLDTMNEYSTQFRKIGMDGATAVGLMNQALQAGARDADVAADAVKEFTLQSLDLTKAGDAYKALGLDGEAMVKALAGGGPKAAEATRQIFDAMHKLKDPVELNTVSLGLFGTKAEDLGGALKAMDPTTAAKSLGDFKGAAEQAGNTLHDNTATRVTAFTRTVQTGIVDFIGSKVIPGLQWMGREFAPVADAAKTAFTDTIVPAAEKVADKFAPIAGAAKETFTDVVIPALVSTVEYTAPVVSALGDVAKWLWENRTPIGIVAGAITVLLLPALVAWGVTATTSAIANGIAWLTSTATAVSSSATQVLAHWAVVGGWLKAAGQAIASAAVVVGQWVLMGAQALLQAGRMALAWVIAMGPIALLVAAIVGLALIIWQNWESIKQWTIDAFNAVWDWVKTVFGWLVDLFLNFTGPGLLIQHWDTIKSATADAFRWVADKAQEGLDAVVGFFRSLPGRILGFIGDVGGAAVSIGRSIIDGLGSGLSKVAGFGQDIGSAVARAVKGAINGVVDLLNDAIPDRIGIGPVGVNLPRNPIPRIRAAGGPASGLTRVGERGPEWVRLPRDSTVIPNHAAPADGAGVVVNVRTNADPAEVGRAVAWALRTATR
ncbi:phage tail tape measure protein [Streptomyces luteireticuli]|uniref:Phage tail tape measure protein domain-containing protein n=1 Tax=Streptomyces luteireticuli TaxID=173858 RepID=A0ABN0Z355_9ACTN